MNKRSIKSDLARIDSMREADIDYSDIPPLDKSFLTKATVAACEAPGEKKPNGPPMNAD